LWRAIEKAETHAFNRLRSAAVAIRDAARRDPERYVADLAIARRCLSLRDGALDELEEELDVLLIGALLHLAGVDEARCCQQAAYKAVEKEKERTV
jgi:hypothetical protein